MTRFHYRFLRTQQLLHQKLTLGLDIGTSSVRAALYDERGDMLRSTFVKNERTLTATDDGGAEIDADVALGQIERAIDDVLAKSSDVDGQIECVAASCFWHSLVGVDARGKPTTKVLGWADTRSNKQAEILRNQMDESAVHDRTGARFHSSFWPAKLRWFQKEFPDTFKRTYRWLSLSDLVALKFFGEARTSISMASGTGMFDIRKCIWDQSLLRRLQMKNSNLPHLPTTDDETFRLAAKYSKRWPRLKDAGWFPAIGDGAANNIGAGCVKKSKAALMIGTSGAMRVAYRDEPPAKIPRGLWCYRIDRNRVIMGGALSDGGGLYGWLKDNLKFPGDDDRTEAEIAKRDPASHGLTVLPFFAGERSTGYNENARGAILGMRTSTDAIDIVQAALEAVAYRFAEIFEQLDSVCRVKEIVASGGALRASPVWTQMIADVIGRGMTLPETHEASMRGAVLLALESTGRISKIEDVPTPSGKQFTADKSRKKVYSAARKVHQAAYKLLIDRDK
jgi:gluconokinase